MLDLIQLFRDTEKLVSDFFDPISASPLHVYHSALPLMPRHTILFRKFRPELVVAKAKLQAILQSVDIALEKS